jgi:hypothetical protein
VNIRPAGSAILAENWWSGWKLIDDFTTIDLIGMTAPERDA